MLDEEPEYSFSATDATGFPGFGGTGFHFTAFVPTSHPNSEPTISPLSFQSGIILSTRKYQVVEKQSLPTNFNP